VAFHVIATLFGFRSSLMTNMSSIEETKGSAAEFIAQPIQQVSGEAETPVIQAPPAGSWTVLVQGIALFSDGYNVQVIGYMNPVLAKL